MDPHLVCDTQPLCLCVGDSKDRFSQYECECTGNIVGFRKDICEQCGAPMAETVDD